MTGPATGSSYAAAGVDSEAAERALGELLASVRQTLAIRSGAGRPLLGIGHYANVLDLGHGLGLAISTDGVGTKALVAQELGRYDTIGIDCVAMNANDVVCVGAEPIAMVDYIAVVRPDEELFAQMGRGLLEGARRANINIPGGEVAQIGEMIRGHEGGHAFDLVGTCVGLVRPDAILTGREIEAGDLVIGLRSSGIHSNGLSLARRVARERGIRLAGHVPELRRTLGEELLEPTTIYVRFAVAALAAGLPVKALAHITGDGFLNILRVDAPAEYVIEELFEIPVFDLIQQWGGIPDEEMFRVFNMGAGFCVVASPGAAPRLLELARDHGHEAKVIGQVRSLEGKAVHIPTRRLRGAGGRFERT